MPARDQARNPRPRPFGLLARLGPCLLALTVAAATAARGAEATDPLQGRRMTGGMSGSGATTQLFGVRATGSKFVYVIDRSRSMGFLQGEPLRAAKAELIASLKDLRSVNQFQIVSYNERPSIFNPSRPLPPKVLFGTEDNKELAAEFIRSMTPAGGTNHADALRVALGLQADVIFLLTDADEPRLGPKELEQVRRWNRTGTVIHAVEFGAGPFLGRDDFLVRLATQNNGQHVYINVSELGKTK